MDELVARFARLRVTDPISGLSARPHSILHKATGAFRAPRPCTSHRCHPYAVNRSSSSSTRGAQSVLSILWNDVEKRTACPPTASTSETLLFSPYYGDTPSGSPNKCGFPSYSPTDLEPSPHSYTPPGSPYYSYTPPRSPDAGFESSPIGYTPPDSPYYSHTPLGSPNGRTSHSESPADWESSSFSYTPPSSPYYSYTPPSSPDADCGPSPISYTPPGSPRDSYMPPASSDEDNFLSESPTDCEFPSSSYTPLGSPYYGYTPPGPLIADSEYHPTSYTSPRSSYYGCTPPGSPDENCYPSGSPDAEWEFSSISHTPPGSPYYSYTPPGPPDEEFALPGSPDAEWEPSSISYTPPGSPDLSHTSSRLPDTSSGSSYRVLAPPGVLEYSPFRGLSSMRYISFESPYPLYTLTALPSPRRLPPQPSFFSSFLTGSPGSIYTPSPSQYLRYKPAPPPSPLPVAPASVVSTQGCIPDSDIVPCGDEVAIYSMIWESPSFDPMSLAFICAVDEAKLLPWTEPAAAAAPVPTPTALPEPAYIPPARTETQASAKARSGTYGVNGVVERRSKRTRKHPRGKKRARRGLAAVATPEIVSIPSAAPSVSPVAPCSILGSILAWLAPRWWR